MRIGKEKIWKALKLVAEAVLLYFAYLALFG